MARSAIMNVMMQAAFSSARSLMRDYGEALNLQASLKGPDAYIRIAVQKSADILKKELLKARPDYSLFFDTSLEAEEADCQHSFLVSAVAGGGNYLHALPSFSIVIALQRQKEIVASLVYTPVLDELFSAERGQGAYLNDRRIRVAGRRKVSDCLVAAQAAGLASKIEQGPYLLNLRSVMGEAAKLHCVDNAALHLCYVAAGRYDAFWAQKVKPAEAAAGQLLVQEAGGFVTDCFGKKEILEKKNILAANEYIHGAMLKLLQNNPKI